MPQPFSRDYRKMNIRPLIIHVKTALLSIFWGFLKMEYGIVLTAGQNANFGKIGLKNADFDFHSEILNDHLLDAAWANGELRLDQEGSDAASN